MTGGTVVILGPVGDNFAAGMTGGTAFVLDTREHLSGVLNPDTAQLGEPDADDLAAVKALLERHAGATGSEKARALLADWPAASAGFRCVRPKDVREPVAAPPERPRTAEMTASSPAGSA